MIARSLFVAGLLAASACSADPQATSAPAGTEPAATMKSGKPFAETVVADFDSPWAMTFLPDGRMPWMPTLMGAK